jgi:3-isopropylmalate/(R)-2-methylmalate dehydratase small subunit
MSGVEAGRAFVFGDNIDTDVLAPGSLMKLAPEALAKHCLEAVAPTFAATVRPGDLVVAGANFGMGSSREQAAVSLKLLGVRAVLATSFARIFWRNAINLGLPALVFPDALSVLDGDRLNVDAAAGRVENLTQGRTHTIQALPPHLMEMIAAGGLIPHLKRRLGAAA